MASDPVVITITAPDVSPGVRAALAYIEGLHAFTVACIRADVDAMHKATQAIEDAAYELASQPVPMAHDAR